MELMRAASSRTRRWVFCCLRRNSSKRRRCLAITSRSSGRLLDVDLSVDRCRKNATQHGRIESRVRRW